MGLTKRKRTLRHKGAFRYDRASRIVGRVAGQEDDGIRSGRIAVSQNQTNQLKAKMVWTLGRYNLVFVP